MFIHVFVFGSRRSMDRTQDCGSCNVGSIPAESTNINILAKNNMMNLRQEISPEMPKYGPEFEVDKELTEEEKKRLEDNKKYLEAIEKHLSDYKDFYESFYAEQTRKAKDIGFNKSEKYDILIIVQQIQESLKEIVLENNIKINLKNHFDHILGNSTVVFAGGKARRYKEGKVIQFDDALRIKKQLENLNFFVEEAVKDKKLLEKELSSPIGYLDNFLSYMKCDLPSDSQTQLNLFKFFRSLELGKMKQDDFWKRAEELRGFIDIEKLKGDLTEDKVFNTFKLKDYNQTASAGETIH